MKIVYKEEISLFNETSKKKIFEGLAGLNSVKKFIFDILMPLAEEEQGIEDMFDELDEMGLMREDEQAERKIALEENTLIITLSQGDEVTKQIQSLYN